MQSNIDDALGAFSVSTGAVRPEVLDACREEAALRKIPLADILLEKGVLDLESVLGALVTGTQNLESSPPLDSNRFGEIAVEMGFLHPKDLEKSFREMRFETTTPLGQHLVRRRLLTAEQVIKILREQDRRSLSQLPSRIGRYEIREVIGRGGMANVYRAYDSKLGREVALKVLKRIDDPSPRTIERFHREATLAGRLRHPNIVAIHEVGVADRMHYIAMDLVTGDQLSLWVRRHEPTIHERVEMIQKITGAMAYAHKQGVVHRDLKPENIIVDGDGQPRLTDFGLAKGSEDEAHLTRSGIALGTPLYMSPEQVRGESDRIDKRTDVWSLGALLYELITKRPPFQGKTVARIYENILGEDPDPTRKQNTRIDSDLDTITMTCLQKEPELRYDDAGALDRDLRRWLRQDPIEAHTPPLLVRLRIKLWRRRTMVGGVLAGITGASVMLIAVLVGALGTKPTPEPPPTQAPVVDVRPLLDQGQEELTRLDRLLGTTDWTGEERREMAAKARTPFKNALLASPDHPEALLGIARAYLMEENQGLALEFCTRSITADPKFIPAYFERARLRLHIYEKKRHLTDGFIRDETVKSARLRARIMSDLNEVRRGGLGEDAALYANGIFLFTEGNYEEAADKLTAYANKRISDPTAWYWAGHAWYHCAGEHRNTIECLSKTLSYRPRTLTAHSMRGSARLKIGDVDGALDDANTFLAQLKTEASPYHVRALARAIKGDLKGAVEDYNEAIRLEPGNANWHMQRAIYRSSLGESRKALDDLNLAIELNPKLKKAYINRAILYRQLGETEAMIRNCNQALSIDKEYVDAYFNRATAYITLGKDQEALSDLNQAVDLAPDRADLHWTRGVVFKRLGKLKEAILDYDSALKIKSDDPGIYLNRANARRELSDLTGAIDDYTKAIELRPDYTDAHFYRGLAYELHHQLEKAAVDYRTAIRLAKENWPHLPAARQSLGRVNRSLEK